MEFAQKCMAAAYMTRRFPFFDTESGKRASRFSDVPLGWMDTIRSIRQVGYAQVLATSDQILHPLRNQSSKRNLERAARCVEIVITTGRWVKIKDVMPDSHGVGKLVRQGVLTALPWLFWTNMGLGYGKLSR